MKCVLCNQKMKDMKTFFYCKDCGIWEKKSSIKYEWREKSCVKKNPKNSVKKPMKK